MRKQQPPISEDKILEASWELMGEEGIEKFSMRRLADRLGIQAPSLYWHFKSKQHLYQRLGNQISRIIFEEFHPKGDWKDKLSELAATFRNVLRRYPCSTQIMMQTMPHEPDYIRLINCELACLESAPLEQEQKFQVLLTLMNYVCYFVLDGDQHQRNVDTILKEQGESSRGEMARLLDSMSEAEAGLFRAMYKSGVFELMGTDEAFQFGLRVILLGIEQVMMKPASGN